MLVFGATTLVAVFLVLLQQPSRESATWLPYLAAVWALMLPVTSFVQVLHHSLHCLVSAVISHMGSDTHRSKRFLASSTFQCTFGVRLTMLWSLSRQLWICRLCREICSACTASHTWR